MSVKSLLLSLILLAGWQAPAALAAEDTAAAAAGAPASAAAPAATAPGAAGGGTETAATPAPPVDVVLVLDNSGSMKKNDPEFLTSQAVKEFVSRLDSNADLGIVIFDQDVQMAMPLTPLSEQSREKVSDSLARINYKGLFTDSPAAVERAIYELKNNGREDARKFIVFMTDGIVDTGNEQKDLEKTRWLREDLAPDAADAGIRIFGIAFTNDADFQLIQSLAQKTGGEYFRALQPAALKGVFERISSIMAQPPEAQAPAPEPQAETPPRAEQPPPQPVVINVPEPASKSLAREERTRSLIIIAAAVVLVIALVVMIVVLVRRGRELHGGDGEGVSEAYLNDIHGYTSQASYRLGSRPTMLGRVAGKDTAHLDYIVIPESTIGRRHALIEYKDYAYWIVDQGSINGTYVNDVPINSEVRLKHGDRIRLHKLEFEFLMPEMDEAGMTVMSNTVFAQGSDDRDAATLLKGGTESAAADMDLDLDFSGSATETGAGDEDLEATLLPESGSAENRNASVEDEAAYDSEDETLMPGGEEPEAVPDGNIDAEDETLLPGEYDLPDEDETLRHDASDEALEDFFDLPGNENGKKGGKEE